MEGIVIQYYKDDTSLNIYLDEDLKRAKEGSGYIEISTGSVAESEIFWDNINFFIGVSKKDFEAECKKELKKCGFKWKEAYEDIKYLISKAKDYGHI